MSGGHFNNYRYIYWNVYEFADELELEIENNEKKDEWGSAHNLSEETLATLRSYVPQIRKVADIMKAIDYLYSGDHGEDSFMEKIRKIEEGK